MEWIIFVPLLVSFFLTLVLVPKWINKCRQTGMLWEDMNKPGHPKNVASSGGIVVVLSFVLGILVYIALRTFLRGDADGVNTQLFSLLSVLLILSVVGLTDDLLGWKHGGLSKRFRIFLVVFSSIPLVVINAGHSVINFPFLGQINLGLLYPLIVIPLGITGATTTYNFLAGFNGLESGLGVIILTFLSLVAYATGTPWLALVGLTMVAALLAFFIYNKFPAKVFPGDILTYSIGALVAIMAILGNFEKIALFVFIPFIAETILKCRGGLCKHSFGRPNKDGSLELPYNKIYGLTHLSIWILKRFKEKVYESDVVYLIFAIEILFCLGAMLIFLV
jgi:UDP-N-acetylglucosamine--dolichyl-phosphate N-acetylglucosaminephosphotransferase